MLGPLLVPRGVHAQGEDILRIGLIGSGLRGSGAAADALTADPRTELVAIGDAFADQARRCRNNLARDESLGPRVKVDDDHLFWGFDAYRRVIDSGVDVVLLTTPPHFRPEHLEYAIRQGKHCFVEKPIAVDAPGVRRVQAVCEQARQTNLAIVSGLCYRYHPGVVETIQRIRDGAIGQIIAIASPQKEYASLCFSRAMCALSATAPLRRPMPRLRNRQLVRQRCAIPWLAML